MLISAPFLKAGTTEDMVEGIQMAFTGQYPVTSFLEWHNGQHLIAPQENGGFAEVRAIADGKVVYTVAPDATPSTDKAHAQNYAAFGSGLEWTDKGMVIIEHSTEIGADGATPTVLKFYSVYSHLKEIAAGLAKNPNVYRKDVLGKPGQIYGQPGHIHFEICLNDTNIKALLGRVPADWPKADAAPTKDGRTDAVFGSTYIYLPASTPIQVNDATHHMRAGATQTLGTEQWVQISYAGNATFTSYTKNGVQIGNPFAVPDVEYKLYEEANARHNSLGVQDKAHSSPSGWYELLRFGRNLGRGPAVNDKDPLPINAAHWREIVTPLGNRWVDLNAEGTFKFSDADFPAFLGWGCYGDDTANADQRCDSPSLKALLVSELTDAADKTGALGDPLQMFAYARKSSIKAKLRKAICKFPTEFDQGNFEQRYGHIKEEALFAEDKTGESWKKLSAHIKSLTVTDLPTAYKEAQWHLHPLAFIEVMRKCGWLSNNEFAQCFPRTSKHLSNTAFASSNLPWSTAIQRATSWSNCFNLVNRKYAIDYPRQRLAHYLSHVISETGNLSLVKEVDNSTGTYLSGKPYYPYYGRGLIQLTWEDSYKKYGKYRKFPISIATGRFATIGWSPDSLIAESNTTYNLYNCADTAGFYIASHSSMLRKMDIGTSQADAIAVSKCVNGDVAIQNLNGLDIRLQSIIYQKSILLDGPESPTSDEISFMWRRNSSKEIVGYDANHHPIKKFLLTSSPWVLSVSLVKQRP